MTLTPEERAAFFEETESGRLNGIMQRAECDMSTAAVAISLADEYAPAAPIELRNEAAKRAAGWLRDMPPALMSESETSESSGRSHTRQYRTSAANPLRASGGMAILARYVERRAI